LSLKVINGREDSSATGVGRRTRWVGESETEPAEKARVALARRRLADTADGFMSSRPRERILEIMHDSHIGTMGVLSIVAILGLQMTALAVVSPNVMPIAAGLAALSGRCAMVFYIGESRYARETGLGQIMFRKKPVFDYLLTGVIWGTVAWILCQYRGLISVAVVLIFVQFWIFYTKHKIGGATGDTIGACEILSETFSLLVLITISKFLQN
jgi:adenosylcobinamide-GDP ribazoletransferase